MYIKERIIDGTKYIHQSDWGNFRSLEDAEVAMIDVRINNSWQYTDFRVIPEYKRLDGRVIYWIWAKKK